MTIETKRIYEIKRDEFWGVFQDKDLNPSGTIAKPVAVIEWNNELRIVAPYQVKFKEEQ